MQQAQLNVRLPQDLLDQVEAYRQKLEQATGLTVNRSDAVRVLLATGLETKAKESDK